MLSLYRNPVKKIKELHFALLPAEAPDCFKFFYEEISANCSALLESNNFLSDKVDDSLSEMVTVKKDVTNLQTRVTKLEFQNAELKSNKAKMQEYIYKLESQQHKENLVFTGIAESKIETNVECANKVKECLKCIPDFNIEKLDIKRSHRLGKYNQKRIRPVIMITNLHLNEREQ